MPEIRAKIQIAVKRGFKSNRYVAKGYTHLGIVSFVSLRFIDIAACLHDKIVYGGGRDSVEEAEFYWVNIILGNLKISLRSTYHAIRLKYAQRYLSEFQYRFNRRFDLCELIPKLAYVALRTPPMPERLLKLGLA